MDGSARFASRPSSRLGASRTSPPLRMCTASRTVGSGTREAGPSTARVGIRGSASGIWSSWVQVCEPERRLLGLRLEVGERQVKGRRAGDQDHVISYSHSLKRRIRPQQPSARCFPKPSTRAVAVDRSLHVPADRHSDAAICSIDWNRERDQGSPGVDALPTNRLLKVRLAAEAEALLHAKLPRALRSEAVAALAPAVLHHPGAASRCHAAKEAVHATAVSLLGLIRSLDGEIPRGALWNRGSVPDDGVDIHDTACITSSSGRDALRHAQAFVTLPARKQIGT